MSFPQIVVVLGALQAVLLSLLLLSQSTNKRANRYLVAFLLIIAIASSYQAFESLDFYIEWPHIMRLNWGLPLLFGPLFYRYTRQLIAPDLSTDESEIWNFLPYILNLAALLPFFLQTGESKVQVLNYFSAIISQGTDGYHYYYIIMQFFSVALGIYYGSLSLEAIRKFRAKMKNEFASPEQIKLHWHERICYLFIFLFIVYAIAEYLTSTAVYPIENYEIYFYCSIFFLIYLLTFRTMKEGQIELIPKIKEEETIILEDHEEKTIKEKVVEQEELKRLLDFVEDNQAYLNGELTATELANQLNISRHKLSELLNNGLEKSFYEFINTYRVDTFKQRLTDPEYQHLTLLGIALASGFNSKTSFNTIFKRFTGKTPSQYRKGLIMS